MPVAQQRGARRRRPPRSRSRRRRRCRATCSRSSPATSSASKTTVDGTRVGVVATRGKGGRAAYPLGASGALLRYFNDYFALPYPLPKLDQIAIAGGFSGGMENWGAIVYNESVLLVDPATATAATRQRVHGLIAHEMAHQWFGNLVTMAWWDNLWLNEAFADWMATKANAHCHPGGAPLAARARARPSRRWSSTRARRTHPIQQPVTRDSEAESAFDTITYDKGSAFLRMLEAYLGETPFRDGIRAYLARHRYANTTSADLWAALADASGKPVAAIAADWTTQPGFPLLDVDAQCDGGRRRVVIRQQPFRVPDDGAAAARAAASDAGTCRCSSAAASARATTCSSASASATRRSRRRLRRAAHRRRRRRRLLSRPLCGAAVRRAGHALAATCPTGRA